MKDLANNTELRMLVKLYEEVDIRRSATIKELVATLENGYEDVSLVCPLVEVKETMETYIQNNIRKMRTQLPDCNGRCTNYGCPDGVVTNCYIKLTPLLEKE